MKAAAYPHPNRAPDAAPLALAAPETTPRYRDRSEFAPSAERPARTIVLHLVKPPELPPKRLVPKNPDTSPTAAVARNVITKRQDRDPWKVRNVVLVWNAVTKYLAVDMDDLLSDQRHPRIVWARHALAYLLRERTTLSWPEIMRLFGRTSHAGYHDGRRKIVAHLKKPTDDASRQVPTLRGPVDVAAMLDAIRTEVAA